MGYRDVNGNSWAHQMAFRHVHLLRQMIDVCTVKTVAALALEENNYQQTALHVAAYSLFRFDYLLIAKVHLGPSSSDYLCGIVMNVSFSPEPIECSTSATC